MNNPELDSILKKARLPKIPEEFWQCFRAASWPASSAMIASPRGAKVFRPHLAWAFGLAACVVIAFAIGLWRGRMEGETFPTTDSLAQHQTHP